MVIVILLLSQFLSLSCRMFLMYYSSTDVEDELCIIAWISTNRLLRATSYSKPLEAMSLSTN